MKIRFLPLLLLPLLFLLFLASNPVRSLSCYKDCIKENIAGGADPIYYHESDYSPLESSCLEEVQTCEDPSENEKVYCASVRLGPDHYIGDHDESILVESVDHFFCMYIYNHSEGDPNEETCELWGAFLGENCNVTSFCQNPGCNAPLAEPAPLPSTCYSCELFTDQFCQSVDIQGSCDLVNCTAGVSQCYARFNQESCSVSLGCASPDISGCEDGSSTCSVCAAEDCTGSLTSDAICGSDSGCEQRECRACTYPACEGDASTIPDSCQYQNCSPGVTECYSQINSCQITLGCKPESFSCEDDADSCSICEDVECSLNTSGICEKRGECAPPHQCITCSHPLCGDEPETCTLQECDSDVQQCYTKVEGCLVTRGCKSPDVTCKTDDTCTVCEGEECDLPDQSLCQPGGGCEEKIVCNSCNLNVTAITLSDDAKTKCSQSDTCSKDAKVCAVFVKENECGVTVGCHEDEKNDANFLETFSGSFSDLITILDRLSKRNDIIDNCIETIKAQKGSASRTRINLSLLILALFYLTVLYYT